MFICHVSRDRETGNAATAPKISTWVSLRYCHDCLTRGNLLTDKILNVPPYLLYTSYIIYLSVPGDAALFLRGPRDLRLKFVDRQQVRDGETSCVSVSVRKIPQISDFSGFGSVSTERE